MTRGIYRVHGLNGRPDDVRIDDDGIEAPLEESVYRARGYLPLIEQLLWREDYIVFKEKPVEGTTASRTQARHAFLKSHKM